MNKKYYQYHKHTCYSNIFTSDSVAKIEDYCKRAVELGHDTYFTTEHGYGGDIFESYKIAKKYNLKTVFAMEGYIVKDVFSEKKDDSNYHIMLIAKTDNGRKRLNKILSHANRLYFYRKPRVNLQELLALDKDDIFITSACVAGLLRTEDSINNILIPLMKHFKENLFIEVQSHNVDIQKEINQKAIDFVNMYNKEYGIRLISANDSHYVYSEDKQGREDYLHGKKMFYPDEAEFILDYPDYDEIINRYEKQGVLSKEQAIEALDNTNIFECCEPIVLDTETKMPNLYPNLSEEEKFDKLTELAYNEFSTIIKEDGINKGDIPKYKKELDANLAVVKDTSKMKTADYFLLDYSVVDLATKKYGGILTRSGRGSCGAFYLNRVLGLTQIDKFATDIPIYGDRFLSVARTIENRSYPDIDLNVVDQAPFEDATRELLGKYGCYPMVAFGTMQESESFRNLCRAKDIDAQTTNNIAKNIKEYEGTKEWGSLIEQSKKTIGTVTSASKHASAYLLLDKDIEEEIGVLKIGNNLCAAITGEEAEEWKYVKNDYLVVTVWAIIAEVFKMIDTPIYSLKDLEKRLDEKTWDIYKNGLTSTINQLDSSWATSLAMRYKPHSIDEIAKLVASIRPSFNPWREDFITRHHYTSNVKQLDSLLSKTDGYILFQENVMQYFEWLGTTPAESIGLIKKISKKKIEDSDFLNLEERLKENWIKKVSSLDGFKSNWDLIQSCMAYGFNSPHALGYAYDSIYGAYLKAHHPLEYFTATLNFYQKNDAKTPRLTKELDFFKIKIKEPSFRNSKNDYFFNKETNTIYKGIGSIKTIASGCGDLLYSLKDNKYENFTELLKDMYSIGIKSSNIKVLIAIDFFSEFGNTRKLTQLFNMFEFFKRGEAKSISKKNIANNEVLYNIVAMNANETEKTFTKINCAQILKDTCEWIDTLSIKEVSLRTKITNSIEYLGYISYITEKKEDRPKLIVLETRTMISKKNNKPWGVIVDAQSIGSGIKNSFTVQYGTFKKQPIQKYDIIYAKNTWKNEKGYWCLNSYDILEVD